MAAASQIKMKFILSIRNLEFLAILNPYYYQIMFFWICQKHATFILIGFVYCFDCNLNSISKTLNNYAISVEKYVFHLLHNQ